MWWRLSSRPSSTGSMGTAWPKPRSSPPSRNWWRPMARKRLRATPRACPRRSAPAASRPRRGTEPCRRREAAARRARAAVPCFRTLEERPLSAQPARGAMTFHFPFDNSYARLPERFFTRTAPTPVGGPRLVRLNRELALHLGLDPDRLAGPDGVEI